jgi:hypothetical protein
MHSYSLHNVVRKTGYFFGGKSKAVTYAFPPGYRENAEEEEEEVLFPEMIYFADKRWAEMSALQEVKKKKSLYAMAQTSSCEANKAFDQRATKTQRKHTFYKLVFTSIFF